MSEDVINIPDPNLIKDPTTGTAVGINDSGQMHVVLRGAVCPECSTTSPLGAGGVFTGTAVDILDYGIVFINVWASVASATDGLSVQQSADGTNWDNTDEYTVPANSGKTFSVQPAMNYLRIVYTNGAAPQTTGNFRLQTVLKKTNSLPSSHRIQDSIIGDDDATLQKSVLTAKRDDDAFVNITATDSNNLRVSDAENGLAIAKGDVADTSFIHKFGNTPDFDSADNTVTIYDGADKSDIAQMTYVYSTSAAIDSLSSSDNGDTFEIEVQGLDTNYGLVNQTITLTGNTRAALTTSLIRVFRMKNVNATDNLGHVYCFENTTLGTGVDAGIPVDTTKVRAVMQPGNNQTLMAVYTIPDGYTGYLRDWYAATAGASKSTSYIIDVRARKTGGVFQLKHRSALADAGTSYVQHKYEEPEVFTERTDLEMRATIADASKTGASVSAGFDIVLIAN